jgi:flagellar basal body-associated protein FliL
MIPTRRSLAALVLLPLLASTAHASDKKKADEKGGVSGPPHVDLAPVASPIVVNGQVKNYVFITVRLTTSAGADLKALREKEPLLRDVVVRVAHRTPFNRGDSYNAIDETKARGALASALAAVAGKGQIKTVEIIQQQPKNLVRGPRS